jgi:hypothetical protein
MQPFVLSQRSCHPSAGACLQAILPAVASKQAFNSMPRHPLAYLRAYVTCGLIAMVQLAYPAAAADRTSKINPTEWTHRHTSEEIQAMGVRPHTEVTSNPGQSARLRRIQRRQQTGIAPRPHS